MKKTLLLSVLMSSALSSAYAGDGFVEFPEWDTTGFVNEVVLKANHDWCRAHTVVEAGPLNYGNKYKDSIEITATSDLPCVLFTGWSDGVKAQTRFFSGSGTDTLTAYFESAPKTTHTITPADETMGDAYAQFGDKGEKLRGQFEYDPENHLHASEPLILKAIAKSGYKFSHWEDGSTNSERVIHPGDDMECGQSYEFKAYFEERKHIIVILSSDTTIGTVWGKTKEGEVFTVGFLPEGTGFTFQYKTIPDYTIDYMESTYYDKSLGSITNYSVVGNDTITVHFKKADYHNIVILSSDTTIGTAWGKTKEGEVFTEELLLEGTDILFQYNTIPGYTLDYVESAAYDTISDYNVIGDDTITVHFKKAYEYFSMNFWERDELKLYGKSLYDKSYWRSIEDMNRDSIIVTNKATGETHAYPKNAKIPIWLNDTFLVKAMPTTDGYKSDSVVTLTYDNYFKNDGLYIYKTIAEIGTETAEGDSFNVNIYFYNEWDEDTFESDSKNATNYWEGNGRYAKGDTILFFYHSNNYNTSYIYEDDYAFHEFYLKDTLKIVVNNDININFYQPGSQQGVKNTAAAQETDALVNVYTTSGRLLKARTKMSEALNGLEKGLYVVGRKLVRIKD